jgi:hypothetical protein
MSQGSVLSREFGLTAARARWLAKPIRRSVGLAVACLVVLAGCQRAAPVYDTTDLADDASPADLVAMAAQVREPVERLSGLELRAPLRMRWQSRADARSYVEQRLAQEMPPERLEGVRLTYVTLGVLPDTLDLRALLLDLYTEQVLGYYDPRSESLFLVEGEDVEMLRPVLIHEMVHALQDQHADIEALVAFERGTDRQAAAHATLEGHAMIVMFTTLAEEAARERLDPATLPNPADELRGALTAPDGQFPVFQRAPAIIRETLLFPYVHGTDFVYQLWRSRAAAGRYPAPLDTLLPESTSQVLHPVARFVRGRETPVEPRFAEPATGWQVVYENNLGELETGIILAHHAGDGARRAAQGWAGDRYRLLSSTDGTLILDWVTAWRDAAAADRFAAAARRLATGRPGRRATVERLDLAGHPAVRIVDMPADQPGVEYTPAALRVLDPADVAHMLRTTEQR